MKVLSGLLFTGLVVGLRGNVDVSCEIVSNVCTWSAILLQFSGLLAYVARKRKLRDMYKTDVAKPWDFLGSPPNDQTSTGKTIHGAHVDLDRVTPFWELRDGRADLSSRLRHVPGWDKQPWNQARSARGLLEVLHELGDIIGEAVAWRRRRRSPAGGHDRAPLARQHGPPQVRDHLPRRPPDGPR